MTMRLPAGRPAVDIEAALLQAAKELETLETVQDVRRWWGKHYYSLGHRRLGRLLLGQPVERLLEQAQRGQQE